MTDEFTVADDRAIRWRSSVVSDAKDPWRTKVRPVALEFAADQRGQAAGGGGAERFEKALEVHPPLPLMRAMRASVMSNSVVA